jgi:cell division protein FtsW (lipid II flippase)
MLMLVVVLLVLLLMVMLMLVLVLGGDAGEADDWISCGVAGDADAGTGGADGDKC